MADHTNKPYLCIMSGEKGPRVCQTHGPQTEDSGVSHHDRRMTWDEQQFFLAAANACAGIPVDELENGIIEDLVGMLKVAQGSFENIPEDALGYESDGETQWPLLKEIHSRMTKTLDRLKDGEA